VGTTALTVRRTEHASHPVGTTVKVTDFFKFLPVRKQTALKHSAKWLAKIKRLVQAYALSRPTVRFSLKVLKAKTNRGDFIYAPKATANMEDAAFKVIGKDCAAQCDWTAIESDRFIVHAFLPKPDGNAAKIANEGAFLSIDARPVATTGGTLKKIVTVFKAKLRKANASFVSVKDPFFCMNIICPTDSYDPNIEPAKDDVLFWDEQLVISVVEKLLNMYYPEATVDVDEEVIEPPRDRSRARSASAVSVQRRLGPHREGVSSVPQTHHFEIGNKDSQEISQEHSRNDIASSVSRTGVVQQSQQWRPNMYGIDEEDMELVSIDAPQVLEDEGEMRKAALTSNPWTLARLNAPIKPRKLAENSQQMTPAKGPRDVGPSSSSPTPALPPRLVPTVGLLTPRTTTRSNTKRSATDMSLQQSIQRLPPPQRPDNDVISSQEELDEELALLQPHQQFSEPSFVIDGPGPFLSSHSRSRRSPNPPSAGSRSNHFATRPMNGRETPLDRFSVRLSAPQRGGRKQQNFSNKPFRLSQHNNHDQNHDCDGNSAPAVPRKREPRNHNRGPLPFQKKDASSPQRGLVLNAAKPLVDNRLYSDNNTDIRDFFGRNGPLHRSGASSQQKEMLAETSPGSFLSSSNVIPRSKNVQDQSTLGKDREVGVEPRDLTAQFRAYEDREAYSSCPMSRSQSVEPTSRLRNIGDGVSLNTYRREHVESMGIRDQLHAYAECEAPGSPTPSLSRPASAEVFQRSYGVQDQSRIDEIQSTVSNPRDIEAQLCTDVDRMLPDRNYCVNPSGKSIPCLEKSSDLLLNSTPKGRPESRKMGRARRRPTLPHLRSKSSKLPLERVPYHHRIQDVILPLSIPNAAVANTSVATNYFTSRMRKLCMGTAGNGLEWGYTAPSYTMEDEGIESVFEGRVEKSRVAVWCRLLGSWFETKDGRDSVGIMLEGVWRALSARQKPEDDKMGEVIEMVDANTAVTNVETMNGTDDARRIETGTVNGKAGAEDEDDEYGDIGIDEDDEMLMTG
jgi:DNA mismatch repair ATPase MutL